MKKELILTLILICASFAIAGPLDYPTGLVSYWKLNETSGNAIDSVGSNDGTVTGATQGVAGLIDTAYSFDGVDDYITIADDPSLNLDTEFTYEFIIKGNSGSLYDSGYSPTNPGALELNFDNQRIRITIHSVAQVLSSSATVPSNDWTHLVITRDSLDNWTIYLNGQQDASVISTSKPTRFSTKYISNGRYEDYAGLIDEFAIWNRTLSSSEVLGLYNSYEEEVIPEVNRTLQIFIILIVALLIGALFLRKK